MTYFSPLNDHRMLLNVAEGLQTKTKGNLVEFDNE